MALERQSVGVGSNGVGGKLRTWRRLYPIISGFHAGRFGLLLSYFTPGLLRKGSQVIKERPLPSFVWGILMDASFFFALSAIFIIVIILAVILAAIPVLGIIFNILAVLVGLGALDLAFRQWFKIHKEAAASVA